MAFYPWGALWGDTTNGTEFRFFDSLQWYDPTVDGYQADFRYLIPRFGRWLSPDPMAGDVTNPQSLNRYAYVLNNPTSLTDPLGLCPPGFSGSGGRCSGSKDAQFYMDEFWLWQNSRNGYDVFDAIQGQPTPEQAYAARVQVVFSGVEAANNTLQVWVPTKFTQKGDLIQITLGHNETVNLCFGGDILCDAQGNVVRILPQIESDDVVNAGGAALVTGIAALPTMRIAIGAGEPFHVAYGIGDTWLNAVGSRFGAMRVSQAFAQETASSAWVKFSVPILNTAAVLATEGRAAWTCVTAAVCAVAKGWIP